MTLVPTTKYARTGSHLLFWVVLLVYELTSSVANKNLIGDYWWGDWKILHVLIVGLIFKAIFTYGLIYALVPRFLDRKRFFLFGGLTLAWFFVVMTGYTAVYFYHLEKLYTVLMWHKIGEVDTLIARMGNLPFLLSYFSIFMFPAIVLGAIKFYRRKVQFAQVEEEKNRMELKMLKNQLNPHFLFNTLNNLYAFVMTNSPQAPDMILRLSGILDYALYKSQHKYVPLQEEIDAIDHFIALEKIRYGDRVQIQYKKEGPMQAMISPLILLSLVENAFKHGASGNIEVVEIEIVISENVNQIACAVRNSKPRQTGELNDEYKKGIGLSNVRRQLDLIYPRQHELSITDQETEFAVSLHINNVYEQD